MKITKEEFMRIVSEAVSSEVEEFTDKTGSATGGMAIMLMGLSIGAKIAEKIFDENETEIEIETKE